MEKNIVANDKAIGVPELNHLHDLQGFNKMLIDDEFIDIVKVYQRAIDRTVAEAKKQGIDI